MNFHRRVELRLAVCFAKSCTPVETDCQLRVCNFVALGKANGVCAGHETRPANASGCDLRGEWDTWWLCAHRPRHSIQARAFAGRQFINDTSGGIQDFQFHFSKQMPLALVVIDHRSVRGIVADENRVAIGPPALAFNPLLHRAR